MNDLDLCLEVVSRSRQPLRYIRRWISRKPLEIEAWFQRTTNRKWHTGYRMVTWPMRSRDLNHAPFGENYLSTRSGFPRRSCVPNLKCLAQVVLTQHGEAVWGQWSLLFHNDHDRLCHIPTCLSDRWSIHLRSGNRIHVSILTKNVLHSRL